MGLFDTIERNSSEVVPELDGPIIDKSNVVSVVAMYRGSRVFPTKQGTTTKYLFAIPDETGNGQTLFAVFGDAMLHSLLKQVRPKQLVALTYDGKRDDGNGRAVHTWRLRLMTTRGQELRDVIGECEPVYRGIREAVAQASQRSVPVADGADLPPHTDADLPPWAQ